MRAALALCLLTAAPASANPELLEFMGGQGCTFGADRGAVAKATGLSVDTINAFIAQSLDDGTAVQEGDYVVLGEKVCTIRLPDIESAYTVASPEIVAMTSPIDAYAADGALGCFLVYPTSAFDAVNGGSQGAGFADYSALVGAGIASGQIAFYGTSPLKVPPGFQVVDGPCAEVSNIESIRRSQATLRVLFGSMIRSMGEENTCGPDAPPSATNDQIDSMIRFQGGNPDDLDNVGDGVNAWIWMEILMLSVAAGWHEGMTGTEKGTPRPPLCHYD